MNPKKIAILHLLSDGKFHSGEEIGALLGVSRSAIWKSLHAVSEEASVPIHTIRGKGYKLEAPLSLLSKEEVISGLPELTLEVSEVIDSTNAQARRYIFSKEIEAPFVIAAEMQTMGRGRRGRTWVSPYGQNIYLSYVMRITNIAHLQALSLVVGLAVLNTIKKQSDVNVGLKWPNDVLINAKKVAGILLEIHGDFPDNCHVIIGVGVNLNMMASSEIDQAWTSLYKETGRLINRNKFTIQFVQELTQLLSVHTNQGFEALRADWEKNHFWTGKAVTLSSATNEVHGVALGVSREGELRLLVNQQEQLFNGGELSLRLAEDVIS